MGETELSSIDGAQHASSSADSTAGASPDDPPPIADSRRAREKEKNKNIKEKSSPTQHPIRVTSGPREDEHAEAIEKPRCPHTLSPQQLAEQLGTDVDNGLSSDEAAARLARDGSNTIQGAKGISVWEIFLQQIANALTVVLIAVAAVSFAIGDYVEASVVVAVILLNIVVGYVSWPSLHHFC